MKRYFTATLLAIAMASAPTFAQDGFSGASQQVEVVAETTETPSTTVSLGKYSLKLPFAEVTEKADDNSLIARTADGRFGVSIEVTPDKSASQQGAEKVCSRLVSQYKLQGKAVKKLKVNSLKGCEAQGTLEQQYLEMGVFAGKGEYVRVVVICNPEQRDEAREVLRSLAVR